MPCNPPAIKSKHLACSTQHALNRMKLGSEQLLWFSDSLSKRVTHIAYHVHHICIYIYTYTYWLIALNANHVHDRQYTWYAKLLAGILSQDVHNAHKQISLTLNLFSTQRKLNKIKLKKNQNGNWNAMQVWLTKNAKHKKKKRHTQLRAVTLFNFGIPNIIFLYNFKKQSFKIKRLRRQTEQASSLARRLIGWLLNNLMPD